MAASIATASAGSAAKLQPPPGLKALIDHCNTIYPDQPNPLQVSTLLKYWLGGQDPLDYISMYYNIGDRDKGVRPHWHYISFGLSDLHGDGRVHVLDQNERSSRSGMGFEITFRLLLTEDELRQQHHDPDTPLRPPTWPANVLQAIARYCFRTGNSLCIGDNIPWRKSLDDEDSLMQNILIAQDPQMGCIDTPFGTVDFCQIVGVTEEEMEQASRWNGKGVLNFLSQDEITGGKWLVTNMKRTQSVFKLFPETLIDLQDDLEKHGSDLAGISADFTFREIQTKKIKDEIDSDNLNEQYLSNVNNRIASSHIKHEDNNNFLQSMSISSNSLEKSCPLDYQALMPNCIPLDGIEVILAPYAAKFLMLAIKDRIRHGRHFTFKAQNLALTLVAESVTGSAVSKDCPYGVIGYWIQVMITEDMVPRMMEAFRDIQLRPKIDVDTPLEFEWPEKNLKIIIDCPRRIQDMSCEFENLKL